jgi:hypothetical protein
MSGFVARCDGARSSAHRPPRWLILALLVVAIDVSYLFIVTVGKFTEWPTWNANYDWQAEGFRSGHLYLSARVPDELLAKADPFDGANQSLWFTDASLYKGHYHLYWGPLPAVVLAGIKSAFRIERQVGDQYFVFVFYTAYLIAGAMFIDRMARRLFRELPPWMVGLAVIVFAYANPTPFLIATPGIYEAAIIGGQVFLLLGLLFAFEVVWTDGQPRRRARRMLLVAGTCWGLAITCRLITGPTGALILLATALVIRREADPRRAWLTRLQDALCMAAPMAVLLGGLLLYNKARFDSWFEFGMNYQLSMMRFRTAAAYVWPNLYQFLLRPVQVSCEFPFVAAPPPDKGFPDGYRVPGGYWAPEPLVGALSAAPWLAWLLVAAFYLGRLVHTAWGDRAGFFAAVDPRERARLWCGAVLATFAINALPTVAQFIATMRYLADVSTGSLLLSIWGAWSLYGTARSRPWPRRMVTATVVALAAVTVVVGLLLAFRGYDNGFQRHNPALLRRLVQALSFC